MQEPIESENPIVRAFSPKSFNILRSKKQTPSTTNLASPKPEKHDCLLNSEIGSSDAKSDLESP